MTGEAFDPRRAELDGVQLIEASAGTGKTWTICALVLRLLVERRLGIDRILVVTFTNAATAELRARIRERIVQLRDHLRGDLEADELVRAVAAAGRAAWDDPAALVAHLDLALHGFDEAAVYTIHAFCQRALAGVPFSARVAPAVELLDDDAELRREVVHDFWRTRVAAVDAELAALLLAAGDTPARYDELLRRALGRPLARPLWPADIDAPPPDAQLLADAHAAARALWQAQREAIVDMLIAALPGLHGGTYKASSVAAAAAAWDTLLAEERPAPAAAPEDKAALFTSAQLAAKTTKKAKGPPPAHPFFDAAGALLEARAQRRRALQRARLRLIRELLAEGAQALRARKRERRVTAFDDLLHDLWLRLVGEPLPGLAAALRARHPALLIDEFQDTDPLQFAIFAALHAADPAAGPMFLVGDPKQAIYRFRHADLHAYLAARRAAGRTHTLLANQRADRALIDALNRLFGTNPGAFMIDGLQHHDVAFGSKPRTAFVDRSGSPAEPLQIWRLPAGDDGAPLPKPQALAAALRATAAEIARLLAAARRGEITLGARPLAGGDIAVLVRTHREGRAMRAALAALGVGCVEHSQASVFASLDAEELERCLLAALDPERWELVRGALATSLLGVDAARLLALEEGSDAARSLRERLVAYRALWHARGVGVLLRRWFADDRVAARLLARPDGERRLTNLLHLVELLHHAAEQHASPPALLRWLQAERRDAAAGTAGGEARQLRLESDRHLVQIVTVHKSKGLEYPVVFCPLAWDGARRTEAALPGVVVHDEEGRAEVDYRAGVDDGIDEAALKARVALEDAAEGVRLLYVALTRAEHRCVLVTGSYRSRNTLTESGRALLHWLVAGAGRTPAEWLAGKPAPEEIDAAWRALVASAPHAMRLDGLPTAPGRPLEPERGGAATLVVRTPPAAIAPAWRIASFSSLLHGAVQEPAVADHDRRAGAALAAAAPAGAAADEDDILHFPRGALAGDVLHALFERADFAAPATWPDTAAALLREQGPALGLAPAAQPLEARRLVRLLHDVLHAPIEVGTARPLVLAALPAARRIAEWGFHLPVGRLEAETLNRAYAQAGVGLPRLGFTAHEGWLTGFVDLLFEHDGHVFVLDWKSNHLGTTPADYAPAALEAAMAANGYHLQAHLYAAAAQRWIAARGGPPFGGVLYLFVRGLRPGWAVAGAACGVHRQGPEAAGMHALAALLAPRRG